MTFNELMQRYVNMPYDRLVDMAKTACEDVYPAVVEYFEGVRENASKFFIAAIGACIGADGKLTELEAKFARDVVGGKMTDNFLGAMMNVYGDVDSRDLVDDIIDSLDDDAKAGLCVFCSCFLAVDETIDRRECAFISKLFS